MLIPITDPLKAELRSRGVETLQGAGTSLSDEALFEPPCSIKWMNVESAFRIGAFSYAVSGYYSCVSIGRYTSIGEQVQAGRASHPISWVSTSPFFYLGEPLFDVGDAFAGHDRYAAYGAPERPGAVPTAFRPIRIGNDVYVGHGAMIMPGVTVGDGAVVAANAVVTRDVPPYGIVAGNPARLIRHRLDPMIFAQLLHLRWWRFAPWQLRDVDFSDPAAAIEAIKTVDREQEPYAPALVALADLA